MIYFEKIEAYLSGEMNEMEQSIFEQALEENIALQKEYEAYQTAQDLFNFSAEQLTEEEITTNTATETTEQLINFTAQHLSEAEILGSTDKEKPSREAVIKTMSTRRNRMEWLVAASMLLAFSVIGSRFYSNLSTETITTPSEVVVEKPVAPKVIMPVEEEKVVPIPVIAEPPEKIVKKVIKKKPASKYEPAKVRVSTKITPSKTQMPIAEAGKTIQSEITQPAVKQLALLTNGEKIVTGKVINKGEAVIYQAQNAVILKPGFHAKAGADFVATSSANETVTHLTKVAVIEQEQSVVYNAANSITLKPGFHAKAGSTFVATTASPSTNSVVSTNSVISDKESVVIKAAETITLKAGFHAKAGANFVAKVKE